MTGKTALRAVWQAELTLEGVRVPAENRLANCRSFKDVSQVLDRTRYTVAWRALGLATASYELALQHALQREQFGAPIAGYQLVQDKLARMLAEITAMQLMCWRLSRLADAGRMTAAMASMAKMNHAAKARSEEHTSELQSRQYLVCRLLLEKKKKLQSVNALRA